jgi:hypothetical protein
MATKELGIQPQTMRYVHGSAMDWLSVDLADDQIIEIAKSDPDVWKDLLIGVFDTVTRENFADALASYAMGSGNKWPKYGHGQDAFGRFIMKFEDAARRKGIKLVR